MAGRVAGFLGLFLLAALTACIAEGPNDYAPKPVHASGKGVTACVLPEYPAAMLQKSRSGDVAVVVVVDKTGKPIEFAIPKSTDIAFFKAVKLVMPQWRFEPIIKDGKPLEKGAVFLRFTFTYDAKNPSVSYKVR